MNTLTKKKKNEGKIFEKSFEDSVDESGNWFFRVRDVNPAALKNRFAIPKNPYDLMIFDGDFLYALELKSNQGKSISHRGSNPQIKPHQAEELEYASGFDNIIAGFVINFRSVDKTYFIPIDEFVTYNLVSQGKYPSPYKNKVNEKSIPIDICEEIGIEIMSVKKRVHNRYFITDFLQQAKRTYMRGKE